MNPMNSYDLETLHGETYPETNMTPDTAYLCIRQLMALTANIEDPRRSVLIKTVANNMIYKKFSGQQANDLRQQISSRFDDIYQNNQSYCCCGCCLRSSVHKWCGWTLFL